MKKEIGSHNAYEIQVTPEILRQKAINWEENIEVAKKALMQMESIMKSTGNCFEGGGAEALRKLFAKHQEKMLVQFKIIEEYPQKIQQMADVYEETEGRNRNAIGGS